MEIKTNTFVNVKQSGKSATSVYTWVSCLPTVIYISQWPTVKALQRVESMPGVEIQAGATGLIKKIKSFLL